MLAFFRGSVVCKRKGSSRIFVGWAIMKSFRSSLFQKAGEVSGRSPESPAAAGEIPALQRRRRLLRNPRRGENPEAPPVADEARDSSEQTQSDAAAPRRQRDNVCEGLP